ncbi:hypothetical protein BD770DRAFT_477957 [Pilaira anomala]|nr:hypothetical protein BD770DRAFT_477957 [Pilaira anomala]
MNDFDIEFKAERSKLQETVAYLHSLSGKLSELQIFRLLVPVEVFEPEVKPRQPNTFNFFEKERAIKRRKQTIRQADSENSDLTNENPVIGESISSEIIDGDPTAEDTNADLTPKDRFKVNEEDKNAYDLLSSVEKEELKERAIADSRPRDSPMTFHEKIKKSIDRLTNSMEVLKYNYGCESLLIVSRPSYVNAKRGKVSTLVCGQNAIKFVKKFFPRKTGEEFRELFFPGMSSATTGKANTSRDELHTKLLALTKVAGNRTTRIPWSDLKDPKGRFVVENWPDKVDYKSLSQFTLDELSVLQEVLASDKPVKFSKRAG